MWWNDVQEGVACCTLQVLSPMSCRQSASSWVHRPSDRADQPFCLMLSLLANSAGTLLIDMQVGDMPGGVGLKLSCCRSAAKQGNCGVLHGIYLQCWDISLSMCREMPVMQGTGVQQTALPGGLLCMDWHSWGSDECCSH